MKSQLDMKSQLKETKQEIKKLLFDKYSHSSGANINSFEPDVIHAWFKRDDMPEEFIMDIRRSECGWNITMPNPHHFPDKAKMFEFIEKTLREYDKGCG